MAVGIALVGSGIFAREQHLPAIQSCEKLKLAAVYSRSLKSARSLAANLPTVGLYSDDATEGRNYADILSRSDIEAVIIALPILAQPSYILQALQAGKHVLSEKPIAPTVADAQALVAKYRSISSNNAVTWCVAENFRYLDSFRYGAEKVSGLGKVLGFSTRMGGHVKPGSKYFETAWRKTPEHQGGFLLDGGVHFIAATRLLLGEKDSVVRVAAFTAQMQEHLPPIDTVNAVWHTRSGASGTFTTSFGGGAPPGCESFVVCEQGTVAIKGSPRTVVISKDGKEADRKEFLDEEQGVKQEIAAWAKGLLDGKADTAQDVEQALKDLEILEGMICSGEQNGTPVDLHG